MFDYAIREIASGLGFLEGPVWLTSGHLVFTDIGAGEVNVLDLGSGAVKRFASPKGGPNGLAVGPDGHFYLCNNGGLSFQRNEAGLAFPIAGSHGDQPVQAGIQRISPKGVVETLYFECDGRPLIAPNDLVFDAFGGFYFTDTGHPNGRVADLGGLYYAKADGSFIVELVHEAGPHVPLTQPNGCGLSPDGQRIYVAESGPGRLWAWDIEAPGRLLSNTDGLVSNGAKFIFGSPSYTIFDSLAVDSAGCVCIGTIPHGEISVIKPDGGAEAFIKLPEFDPFPTNICFGGDDLQTAYVTASATGKIFKMTWPRPGLRLNYLELGEISI